MNTQEAINNCRAEGNRVFLPEQHISDYKSFKKLMTDNLGKWCSGKDQAFEFPYKASELLDKLKAGERPNFKKDYDYFPTPEEVVDRMYQITIPISQTVLEPSAGVGAIAEYMRSFSPHTPDPHCVEYHPVNRAKLLEKGLPVVGEDFMDFSPEFEYDVCIANPPFKFYIEHLKRMLSCAREVCCVVPSSFSYTKHAKIKHTRELIKRLIDRSWGGVYEVRSGAFKQSGTDVSTLIVHVGEVDRSIVPFINSPKEKQLKLF